MLTWLIVFIRSWKFDQWTWFTASRSRNFSMCAANVKLRCFVWIRVSHEHVFHAHQILPWRNRFGDRKVDLRKDLSTTENITRAGRGRILCLRQHTQEIPSANSHLFSLLAPYCPILNHSPSPVYDSKSAGAFERYRFAGPEWKNWSFVWNYRRQ